jgi:hypothetical protein
MAIRQVMNHLANAPPARPVRGVKLPFVQTANGPRKLARQTHDFVDPLGTIILAYVLRSAKLADRIAQIKIGSRSGSTHMLIMTSPQFAFRTMQAVGIALQAPSARDFDRALSGLSSTSRTLTDNSSGLKGF